MYKPMRSLYRTLICLALLSGCAQAETYESTTTVTSQNAAFGTEPSQTESVEAPTEEERKPSPIDSTPPLDPIYGYGDFQHLLYADIDWFEVTDLQVRCANEHGVPLAVIPPGDGISFAAVPIHQQDQARSVLRACTEGLNLPEYEQLNEEQLGALFLELKAAQACLEAKGFEITDPPTVETFIESYYSGAGWHPYREIPPLDAEEWQRLNQDCPQP